MLDVYWLEETEADVPPHNEWLCANEIDCLNAMQIPKRRADWRLGRWTAKCAVASYLRIRSDPHTFSAMEIRATDTGAPQVLQAGDCLPITISISHSHGVAACAVSEAGAALGCDLEFFEPRSDAFITDFFAAEEQSLLAGVAAADRDHLATLLWSAKESALKTLQTGLRADTRSAVVRVADLMLPDAHDWHPLEVHIAGGPHFQGWWREAGDFVRTLVAAPAPAVPSVLDKSQFLVS
ncbi:MAG: 4'-phosphopantetheinyl transferase family protein [Terriglobales bacterium]